MGRLREQSHSVSAFQKAYLSLSLTAPRFFAVKLLSALVTSELTPHALLDTQGSKPRPLLNESPA